MKILGWATAVIIFAVIITTSFFVLQEPKNAKFQPTSTPVVLVRGNFDRYTYGISPAEGKNKKLAQFDPNLPSDEATVLGALKAVAKDGLGTVIPENAQPEVEVINEINYVKYRVGSERVLFEIFRNSHGQVGSVRFWAQQ